MMRLVEPMTHDHAVSSMATERYLLEEMPEPERESFEAHYFECADCAEDLRVADLMRTAARDRQPAVAIPFRTKSRSRVWQVAVPWAAAASLALVLGYQSLSPAVDAPYAVEPVTLRAATRGTPAVVALDPSAPAIVLALDVRAPQDAGELAYELSTPDGRSLARGRLPVPAAGLPLMLAVPAALLSPDSRYEIALRPADGGDAVEEFQFDVVNRRNGAQ